MGASGLSRETPNLPAIVEDLAREAVDRLSSSRSSFSLTLEDVLTFLDIERQKDDERQVRELLKQKQGRRYALFPELRTLLDDIAGDAS